MTLAGIYLHIPFCKQACHYCDFHFSTNLSRKAEMVAAIKQEIVIRSTEWNAEPVNTIYFGGGTPSLLSSAELHTLMDEITRHFHVQKDAEITLEANPDDLHPQKLMELKAAGINRLSIGIQSFDDTRLQFIHRAHSAIEAKKCLEQAYHAGFTNISGDLIYAIPPEDAHYWEKDLREILAFNLAHLSIYGLTIEDKTVFGHRKRQGSFQETSEETAAGQYQLAVDLLTNAGYEHYEVSNFARPGMHSRHNAAYWDDQKYLGLGPGAHSYDRNRRGYNISHNPRYIKSILAGELPITWESLSLNDQLNEYLFTHLRTRKGINISHILTVYGKDLLADHLPEILQFEEKGLISRAENQLWLTSEGFMIADEISWRLFYDE